MAEIMTKRVLLASVWIRFFAFLVDGLVISSVIFLLLRPLLLLLGFNVSTSHWLSFYIITSSIVGIVYYVWMTKTWGQTLGKMVFGIRVIRGDGRALDWLTVLFREVIGKFISRLFGLHLGYLWSIFHPKKQTWHDIISDTYVVYDDDVVNQQYIDIEVAQI